MRLDRLPISVLRDRYVPGGWDVLAFVLVFAFFIYLAQAAHGLTGSLARLEATPISLAPSALVGYAARTGTAHADRAVASLLFTFTYATLAAKSRRAEVMLVPLLDFLQSVPILSFSIFILFFLQLTPGRVAGAEMAAIFLIFTSQAWNMAFSFYHSLRSIPDELVEAARNFQLSPWMRFWRLEVPFAHAAAHLEHDDVDVGRLVLRGGLRGHQRRQHHRRRCRASAPTSRWRSSRRNYGAIGWAIAAMFVVILIFDQLLFRPLIASADWFRLEQEAGLTPNRSWALTMMRRSRFLGLIGRAVRGDAARGHEAAPRAAAPAARTRRSGTGTRASAISPGTRLLGLIGVAGAVEDGCRSCYGDVPVGEIGHVVRARIHHAAARRGADRDREPHLGADRGVGRACGRGWRASCSRSRSSSPPSRRTCSFRFVVSAIVLLKLTPDIWLSPLMILGTQWYILFNVIVGASAISAGTALRGPEPGRAGAGCGGSGWRCRRCFPFYVTGAITASGGSWNASIVSEVVSWGTRDGDGARAGRVHSRGDRCGGLPAHGARHGGPEPLRRDAEPALLAAAVRARRAQVPHELMD